MKFLQQIAGNLISEYGNNLSEHTIVFPGRRAGIYFKSYLSDISGAPIWSPVVLTINELFSKLSGEEPAPPEILIFELYRSYKRVVTSVESFDQFFPWGEMILQDFDDIDKYLVNPEVLYQNLLDIKEIDRKFGGLDEDTIRLIREFWTNFNPAGMTDEKERFLSLWDILSDLYLRMKENMASTGKVSDGYLYRRVAEMEDEELARVLGNTTYHFIGFNAINSCEKHLFDYLKKSGKAKFYWDYDNQYYLDAGHRAGYFLRQYVPRYGQDFNCVSNNSAIADHTKRGRVIDIYSASSDSAQTQIMSDLLAERVSKGDHPDHHTAIILADENLLLPALAAIPQGIQDINVTMGYPLRLTPIYGLVKSLLQLQRRNRNSVTDPSFNHREVIAILQHSYLRKYNPSETKEYINTIHRQNYVWIKGSFFGSDSLWKKIFRGTQNPSELMDWLEEILSDAFLLSDGEDEKTSAATALEREYIYHTLLVLRRLKSILDYKDIEFNTDTVTRLIDKVLRNISVPFTGEPLKGIQVMGLLETRGLDFDNVIVLSVNEGTLPKSGSPPSLIPYNLREAFGLPTINHQDSIFSYYFYRLLNGASRLDILYNNLSDGLTSGEMSRFLLQMQYDSRFNIKMIDRSTPITLLSPIDSTITRTSEHSAILDKIYLNEGKKALSPSAINIWLTCRMKFYYKYVCRLNKPERITPEVDPALFGNMIHSAMNEIYKPYTGRLLQRKDIEAIRSSSESIERVISNAFSKEYFKGRKGEIKGRNTIITDILKKYIQEILNTDIEYAPFRIISLETPYRLQYELGVMPGKLLSIEGTIDRIDEKDGITRILDYKSGSVENKGGTIDQLFEREGSRINNAVTQVLLYCELFRTDNHDLSIKPAILNLREIFSPGPKGSVFISLFEEEGKRAKSVEVVNYEMVRDQFMEGIHSVCEEIFDSRVDFEMRADSDKCRHCDYILMCGRQ